MDMNIDIEELFALVEDSLESDLTDDMRAVLDSDADAIARSIIAMADACGTIAHPEVREAVMDAVARYTALVVAATANAARIDVVLALSKINEVGGR